MFCFPVLSDIYPVFPLFLFFKATINTIKSITMFFPSQTPALTLLVLTRLASAAGQQQQAALHDLESSQSSSQAPIKQLKPWKLTSKPGKLTLFPDSTKKPAAHAQRPTCNIKTFPSAPLNLETETCLSGNYYLYHNLLVDEYAVCKDGSLPVLMYYSRSGCVGLPSFTTAGMDLDEVEGTCMAKNPSKYWSLIFRCGEGMEVQEGGEKYFDAVPPTA